MHLVDLVIGNGAGLAEALETNYTDKFELRQTEQARAAWNSVDAILRRQLAQRNIGKLMQIHQLANETIPEFVHQVRLQNLCIGKGHAIGGVVVNRKCVAHAATRRLGEDRIDVTE